MLIRTYNRIDHIFSIDVSETEQIDSSSCHESQPESSIFAGVSVKDRRSL